MRTQGRTALLLTAALALAAVGAYVLSRRGAPGGRPSSPPGAASSACRGLDAPALLAEAWAEPKLAFAVPPRMPEGPALDLVRSLYGLELCLALGSEGAGACDARGAKLTGAHGVPLRESCVAGALNLPFWRWFFASQGDASACERRLAFALEDTKTTVEQRKALCVELAGLRRSGPEAACSRVAAKTDLGAAECRRVLLPAAPGDCAGGTGGPECRVAGCAKKGTEDAACMESLAVIAAIKAGEPRRCPPALEPACRRLFGDGGTAACEAARLAAEESACAYRRSR